MTGHALWLDQPAGRRRFGLKGPRAAQVLKDLGLGVPERPNTWVPLRPGSGDGSLDVIARLGSTEFFIEEHVEALGIAALEQRLAAEAGVYPVLREDLAVVLGGSRAPEALAEVCNVDFTALAAARNTVVMTLMAGVSVLVLPQPDACRIWCDPSFGPYLWQTLAAILNETTIRTTTGRSA